MLEQGDSEGTAVDVVEDRRRRVLVATCYRPLSLSCLLISFINFFKCQIILEFPYN